MSVYRPTSDFEVCTLCASAGVPNALVDRENDGDIAHLMGTHSMSEVDAYYAADKPIPAGGVGGPPVGAGSLAELPAASRAQLADELLALLADRAQERANQAAVAPVPDAQAGPAPAVVEAPPAVPPTGGIDTGETPPPPVVESPPAPDAAPATPIVESPPA